MKIYPWQINTWNSLFSRLDKFLPHAFIFYGASGSGVNKFVEEFSFSLICLKRSSDNFACGNCQNCNWTLHEHPDLKKIGPEDSEIINNSINIDLVRETKKFFELTSHVSNGKKIFVIYDAYKLTIQAANALLKFIEEPPENSLVILTTNQLSLIIPTIISRCRLVNIPNPNYEQASSYLLGLNKKELFKYLPFYNNSVLDVLSEEEMQTTISSIIGELKKGKDMDLINVNSSWLENGFIWLINLLQKWSYEIILFKLAVKKHFFIDDSEDVISLAANANISKLFVYYNNLNEMKSIASRTINKEIMIESLMIEYKKIFK